MLLAARARQEERAFAGILRQGGRAFELGAGFVDTAELVEEVATDA